MNPEQSARTIIDAQLAAASWVVQDKEEFDLSASRGVAIREFPTETGPADYLLFVQGKPVGVVEAKPEGTTLSGVSEQTARYATSRLPTLPRAELPLRFAYESSSAETFFRDIRDPDTRSRRIFSFHRPETLEEWTRQPETLRTRLTHLPPLPEEGLRQCQIEAITNLEQSLAQGKSRALIQMATGAGKTYTAVNFMYRLIKFGGAKRILFLVDRSNLGRQTLKEFQSFTTPDDGRKFTDLYNVQHVTSNTIDPVCKVTICTIQRLYSMLSGKEYDADLDERSEYERLLPKEPLPVKYNPEFPIEHFDFIVTDECHRSIYNLWRQVLEYFDAFLIGLTATPTKQTIAFFNQNLVMEYNHQRAVADGVNVGFDVYQIRTQVTEHGGKVEAQFSVGMRDRIRRATRRELLDSDLTYEARQLDRDVVAPDQIRTVIRAFKERLFTEIFPGRENVPKTLIFAKSDSHAEDIVHIVREEFGKGNDFCKKITYQVKNSENLIREFRMSASFRIAVTVDMIATGTDIKPLECLIFMRSVSSPGYFEQMKGRGTRTISETELLGVSADAEAKTHFVIVDAVGVCERDRTESKPMDRKRSVPFDKLVEAVALGNREEDVLATLAARLARLDRKLEPAQRAELAALAGGRELPAIINTLSDAVDYEKQCEVACAANGIPDNGTIEPPPELVARAAEELADAACTVFNNPKFRRALIAMNQPMDVIIDDTTLDTLLHAGYNEEARKKAQQMVATFQEFITANRDELTALQILYNKPYGQRHLTYAAVKQLAEAIERPPYHLAPERLWAAYEQLDRSRVRGAPAQKLLTNVISLVRFAMGQLPELVPYNRAVEERFYGWLKQRRENGTLYTPEQSEWLEMIKDHIIASAEIQMDDFEATPFNSKGGSFKVYALFGDQLEPLLNELNEVLAA